MASILRTEPITDIKIHRNTKPVVISVFRGPKKKHFEVHEPFKFTDFGITELDELRPIILKKQNVVVKDLMKALKLRYEKLERIPEVLGIPSLLLAPAISLLLLRPLKGRERLWSWNTRLKFMALIATEPSLKELDL